MDRQSRDRQAASTATPAQGLTAARSVRYTPAALRDLDGIRKWFTQPGAGPRAVRRLQHIGAAITGLADHPCRYPVGQHGRREFSVEGHQIVYRVMPDTGQNDTAGDVLVVRVFGPGQSRDRL